MEYGTDQYSGPCPDTGMHTAFGGVRSPGSGNAPAVHPSGPGPCSESVICCSNGFTFQGYMSRYRIHDHPPYDPEGPGIGLLLGMAWNSAYAV